MVRGGRGDLRDGGELSLRRVDAEDVARACPGVVGVADAESATDRCFGADRVSESDTRAEVGEVGIDESLAIGSATGEGSDAVAGDGSGCGGEDGLRRWIPVRDAVIKIGVGRPVLPAQTNVQGQIGANLPVILRVEAVHVLR